MMSSNIFRGGSMPSVDLCQDLLSTIRQGRAASTVLNELFPGRAAVSGTPSHGVVYCLPLFLTGTNIAVEWDRPTVGVIGSGTQLIAQWSANDRKTGRISGAVTISVISSDDEMSATVLRFASIARLHRALSRLVAEGEGAMWQLTEQFRPYITSMVGRVAAKVGREILDHSPQQRDDATVTSVDLIVVDESEIEDITDRYTLGSGAERGLFHRLLERATSDLGDQEKIGDRVTYITRNIRRDAEDEIRRTIGDPQTGRLVRRAMLASNPRTFTELREQFSQMYPNQTGLGERRAIASLQSGPTINSIAQSLESFPNEYLEELGREDPGYAEVEASL